MDKWKNIKLLLAASFLSSGIFAAELPRLDSGVDPKKQNMSAQKKLIQHKEAYFSTSPEDLKDGIQVGTLEQSGAEAAVKKFIANDKAGKYDNLDSLLLWHKGKLVFEMYNRRGRVDGPHYTMSITKTMTSVVLARALQLGLLNMDDLDKPVVDFMPKIDKSKIQAGVDTITLRDALFMKSGLRFSDKQVVLSLGTKYKKQDFFQKLFESTEPVTAKSKAYKYSGTDPQMIMMIIDIKTGGKVQNFIANEVAGKVGAIYAWDEQAGLPKCGAGSSFTSRSLLKFGVMIKQGGKWHGEQVLSPDYVKLIMDTKKGNGYFYYFHNRNKFSKDKNKIDFISGIGAGGQYMANFPDHGVVAVATAENKKGIGKPLEAILSLVPLFKK